MTLVAALAAPPGGTSGGIDAIGYVEDETPIAEAGISATSEAGNDSGDAVSVGRSDTGALRCEYSPLPASQVATILEPDGSQRLAPEGTTWNVQRCYGPDGREVSYNVVPVGPAGAAPVVNPLVLAQRALRQLPLGEPEVVTSPPAGADQLVNLATWLWVEGGWQPQSATASVPGVSVTVTATPRSVAWDMGNGDLVICDGPGMPYDTGVREEAQSTDCSYTYRWSSIGQPGDGYQVTATMTWDVSWIVAGAAGGGELGEVSRSSSFSLRVAEGQAIVTRGG